MSKMLGLFVKCTLTLYRSTALVNHMSLVTGFAFSIAANILYSVGHDKVLNVWDINTKKLKKTLITYPLLLYIRLKCIINITRVLLLGLVFNDNT